MRIVDSGLGIMRYVTLLPLGGYLLWRWIVDGSLEYLIMGLGILVYMLIVFFVDNKTDQKFLSDGRDKNFYKIEIEELNDSIRGKEEIIGALNEELNTLRDKLEEVEKINKELQEQVESKDESIEVSMEKKEEKV